MVEEWFAGKLYLARKLINDCARDSKKVRKRWKNTSRENFENEDLDTPKESDGSENDGSQRVIVLRLREIQ